MHLVELKYKKAPRKDIESITVILEECMHIWTERIAQTLFYGLKLPKLQAVWAGQE